MASRPLQYIAPMSTTPLQCVDIHIRHEITTSPCNGYRHTRINIHAAKKLFITTSFFLLPSSLDQKGSVRSVAEWSLFYSHDNGTHVIHRKGRTAPQHSKYQLLRQAFIFYYHHVWIRKHPSRIGHRIIGRDNQISHGIARAAFYFHDTATQ